MRSPMPFPRSDVETRIRKHSIAVHIADRLQPADRHGRLGAILHGKPVRRRRLRGQQVVLPDLGQRLPAGRHRHAPIEHRQIVDVLQPAGNGIEIARRPSGAWNTGS